MHVCLPLLATIYQGKEVLDQRTSQYLKLSYQIDKLFDHPDKIEIPSRYQPEGDMEDEAREEESRARSRVDKLTEERDNLPSETEGIVGELRRGFV